MPSVNVSKSTSEEETMKGLKEGMDKALTKLLELEHAIPDLTKGESAPNSKIITTPEQMNLLKKWVGKEVMNLKLLYRASKDGFTGPAFHSKCDGKAETVTLIKTEAGKMFGGYLDQQWQTKEAWINSTKCFVFSLSQKEKYTIKSGHEMYAAYGGASYGPSFGGGYDFHISSKAGGALVYSFEISDLNNFTGGSSFTCAEIEVFQITTGGGGGGGSFEEGGASKKKKKKTGSKDGSCITKEAKQKVADYQGRDLSEYKLVFRGTEDGMTPEAFHEKCDNLGSTIVFVKPKNSDDIVGGYTTQPWCNKEIYASDGEAFVFNTQKDQFCPCLITESAIFQTGNTGPYFGDDETLIVFREKIGENYNVVINALDCYQDGEAFSNKGWTFEPEEVEVYEVSSS